MLNKIIYYFLVYPVYKWRLGALGRKSRLMETQISGHKRIFIGEHVFIRSYGWLAAEPVTGDPNCSLKIGDYSYIGRFCHIYASSRIEIGKKVLIADKVYLSDNIHGYTDVALPVIDQPVRQTSPVIIGDGAWLGENVCVIGARIGKNSVVGANSVVTKDIPDYCVAVGSPAIVIKRYNFNSAKWERTDTLGNFID